MKAFGLFCVALLLAPAAFAKSTSVYLSAPDDPRAITVKGVGDGRADDSAALQQAIDAAAAGGHGGIVFLPSGRYRISRTVFVRSAVRVFGVGATRPVILLGDSTPGFGAGVAAMISFTGEDQYRVGKVPVPPPTSVPANPAIYDATSSTFYSALSNVDFEIGRGNSGAVAVRFRVAQHGFLRHIDFHLSSGLAGIYQAGNECENLRFYGGRYGILTEKTSPAWQFTLIDSEFDGQRDAAIREHEVDLTLVNVAIRNTPVGIEIDRGYSDSLWGKDVRFENVSNAGVLISNEDSVFTQIGFDNAIAANTPVFARFRDSGKTVPGQGRHYRVGDFSHGLKLPALGMMGEFATDVTITPLSRMPARRAPAIRALPPVRDWTNVRDLGVKGDDETDDTAALQRAIDSHRVLYLPMGRYRVTDTLKLRPDSVLIALHPSLTHLYLPDETPAYAGVGGARALLQSAKGGDAIVSGLGLWTGGVNPRATALLWKAGAASMVNDVKIQGGGGTVLTKGSPIGFGDPRARFDGQHPSIWVTDGGGGTFAAIWSPNTLASAGFQVSNTKTPGFVYELSAEHHYRAEIVLDNVENWEFLAPQTEQEVRDGVNAISTEFRNSRNILFANYHGYRVTRSIKPMDTAIRLINSRDIRFRNVHVNAESAFASCDDKGCGTYLRASKFPFENAIKDVTRQLEVREREFARLDVPAGPVTAAAVSGVPVSPGVEKLADGFYSIAGAAVDAKGKLYFVDRFYHRIHGWSRGEGLTIVADAPLDPVNLAIDRSGDLMVLSSAGHDASVYSIDPAKPAEVRVIAPTPVKMRPDAATALPVNLWANGEFADRIDPVSYEFPPIAAFFTDAMGTPKAREYVSPDGSLVLPAFRVWNQGPDDHQGWRWSDSLDAHGLVTARPGERIFLTNASENRTYSGLVGRAGTVTDLRIAADRGGESVARDAAGNLYVANGQVFVYGPDGKPIRRIDLPERPLQLVIGGEDRRTLFVLTHHALYAVPIEAR
ncbi:DNA-binding beta-propeller fold protein YncE [Sphingomonas naasensis]|uniref:Gluconolaconase n=1 Tax=Sphingomonas naasensis TaxID=1344951 RepID=A0A4S1WXD7_9SPHN|nr:glycosyl hydrolase family 28-related protein [Sphingomonas naasensis]NIJ19092.1 DNA-binding beta-propeller fold protein YncE [Sphingomonas naasensis]TGX46286.1 gluconolaconase [Sphingomonas naasensis]